MNRTCWPHRFLLALLCAAPAALGQFNSGSTGADGALNYTVAGTYDFDPAALGLNPAGDNVFNFTTINIASGVVLRLRSSLMRQKAAVFLAQGDVNISGTLDLSGATGSNVSGGQSNINANRYPAEPGPGGFAGGVGVRGTSPATAGAGPGGGTPPAAQGCNGTGGNHATVGGGNPVTYGTVNLVPLLGGSGGGGSNTGSGAGGNGGAGGGAIRIVSSTKIILGPGGLIYAVGGGAAVSSDGSCTSGAGAGGAIHLIAPTITLSPAATGVLAYNGSGNGGGLGRIRLSGTNVSIQASVQPAPIVGPLFNPPLPSGVPSVTLTSVNGVPVTPSPTGNYLLPDVTINNSSPVTINLAAANVPLGTAVKLYITSELTGDQVINCNPLAGSVASSTATCTAAFPTGVSRVLVRANW